MLDAAGVPFEPTAAGVDEESAKASLRAEGVTLSGLADALAELKAVKLSARHPQALVLGCDQVASLGDEVFDKPVSRAEAAEQLVRLRGGRHSQTSAAVICEAGQPVWRRVDVAHLTVRRFSNEWLETYLDAEWPAIAGCAGGYRLEGPGAQLFSRIEGDHFTILGLPLIPLLDYLRTRGIIAS